MSIPILEGLNEAQREAVTAVHGPLLIIAGPGSGKTRVITHRIAYLLREMGVRPHRILAVTFTNKAAREMKSRLERLVGSDVQRLTVGTYHAFCLMALRRFGDRVGVEQGFSIFDTNDQLQTVRQAMARAEVDEKQFPRRGVLGVISRAKSLLQDPGDLALQKGGYFEEVAARVYARYQEILTLNNAVDFDDMLMKTVRLFQNDPNVLRDYQERYLHVLVDEFQDTNIVQYELTKLVSEGYRNICVVGDPDQSIYSWRNADIRNILNFKRDYPEAKAVNLSVNYRSTGTVVAAARAVIEANEQRLANEVTATRHEGDQAIIHEAYDEDEEADFVLRQIGKLVNGQGTARAHCAVMFRTNAQSRALEQACARHGTPYILVGGAKFYDRAEVRDVLAYLRLLVNPRDEVSLLRVINTPRRGIGKKSLDRLTYLGRSAGGLYALLERVLKEKTEGLKPTVSLTPRLMSSLCGFVELMAKLRVESRKVDLVELIDRLLERLRYQSYLEAGDDDWEDRWDNVMELRNAAGEYGGLAPGEGLTALLAQVALVADVDSLDETKDAITLITLHQAKGLEFPVVFITGMEEGLLPHVRSMDDPRQLEEERRLCYVGITRCMDRLFLTRAFRRGFWGRGGGPSMPSRFLRDLPSHLVRSADPAAALVPAGFGAPPVSGSQRGGPPPDDDQPEFRTGDRVSHKSFGPGLVIKSGGEGADREVTVAFTEGAGIKRLLVVYAPLEKVEA